MKADTRSANVALAAMKHRLTEFQQNAFERGTNYGVMLAMQAMGVTDLTVGYELINEISKQGLTVKQEDDQKNAAWIFKIS